MSEERESFAGDDGDSDVEARARQLDWVPQDEWKGSPDHWKPAQEYLDYAENVLPILKQNNKKLFADLKQRDTVVATLQQTVNEQAKILKALSEDAQEFQQTQATSKMETLRASLVEANRNGDPEAITAIQEEIMDLKIEDKAAKVVKQVDLSKGESQQPEMSAEDRATWNDWRKENDWMADDIYAAAATAIGATIINDARALGETPPKGRELLDEITKRMDNKFHISRGKGDDRVGTGRQTTGGTGSSGGGKRYSSLPADAKAACEAQAKSRVGAGKRYATLADWQKRFTDIYYSDEA